MRNHWTNINQGHMRDELLIIINNLAGVDRRGIISAQRVNGSASLWVWYRPGVGHVLQTLRLDCAGYGFAVASGKTYDNQGLSDMLAESLGDLGVLVGQADLRD